MSEYVHDDPDDQFGTMHLQLVARNEEYGGNGWTVTLHVPDDATMRAVFDRWGPK